MNTILSLEKLEVYQLAVTISKIAWQIFSGLNWHDKKIMGDQFISATDSVGANIAEGYGRFHYLDKAKFFYNARGSLFESRHWLNKLYERNKISDVNNYNDYLNCYKNLRPKLNGFIYALIRVKNKEQAYTYK